jgi:hypothetical protein
VHRLRRERRHLQRPRAVPKRKQRRWRDRRRRRLELRGHLPRMLQCRRLSAGSEQLRVRERRSNLPAVLGQAGLRRRLDVRGFQLHRLRQCLRPMRGRGLGVGLWQGRGDLPSLPGGLGMQRGRSLHGWGLLRVRRPERGMPARKYAGRMRKRRRCLHGVRRRHCLRRRYLRSLELPGQRNRVRVGRAMLQQLLQPGRHLHHAACVWVGQLPGLLRRLRQLSTGQHGG